MGAVGLLHQLTEVISSVGSAVKMVGWANYQLVQTIISMVAYWVSLVSTAIEGSKLVIVDLVEQYGDFCWATVSALASLFQSLAMGLMLLINAVGHGILHLVNLVVFTVTLPLRSYESSLKGADRLVQQLDRLLVYPVEILEMGVDGVVMIVMGVCQCCKLLLTGCFHGITATLAMTGRLTMETATLVGRFFALLINQPMRVGQIVKEKTSKIPIEALLSLLLVILVVYLMRQRLVQSLLLRQLLFIRRIFTTGCKFIAAGISRLIGFCLSITGNLLMMMFPWILPLRVGIRMALRLVKFVWNFVTRPIGWLNRRRDSRNGRQVETFAHRTNPSSSSTVINDTGDRLLCVVCQDVEKSVLLQPCKHLCLCDHCAHQIYNHPDFRQRNCPVCRSRIHGILNVFV